MLEAIMTTMEIMGWLGLVLALLAVVNITNGTLTSMWEYSEGFSIKKFLKGIAKVAFFYIAASFIGIAFTMLPFINDMITEAFGMTLISSEILDTLSGIGVLGVVVAAVVAQGQKAVAGIVSLANLSSDVETITWTVEEE